MSEVKDGNITEEEEEEEENSGFNLIFRRRPFPILVPDEKDLGIPCPPQNTIPTVEAKAIVLRCVICRENQIQTVNFPCMHACFCINCAAPALNHSATCPQCRTAYMHISMLYLCSGDPTDEDIEPFRKKAKQNTEGLD